MIGVTLVAALTARIVVGDWQITDALVLVMMLVAFPFFEWTVQVFILHWRPRRVGELTIDPLLEREHREHHIDPRDIPLIFIPWKALLWVLPLPVALLDIPAVRARTDLLGVHRRSGLGYEWTHYLIHSDYKPKTAPQRAIWRNHRQHHYKNEHYWYTVTSSGTADRVLGTYPHPATTPSSPTAKNLHASGVSH